MNAESPSPIAQLRRRLRLHNLQVLAFTFLSLVSALFLWGAFYFFIYWILLFLLSAVQGGDARMPRYFNLSIGLVAVTLLAVAILDRRSRVNARPVDKKPVLVIALDFILSLPRVTLAIYDNFSAWLSLSSAELHQAVYLIERVRESHKLPMHAAPVEIPDDRMREKIIMALLLLQVLEVRQEEKTTWLRLAERTPPPAGERSSGPRLN